MISSNSDYPKYIPSIDLEYSKQFPEYDLQVKLEEFWQKSRLKPAFILKK